MSPRILHLVLLFISSVFSSKAQDQDKFIPSTKNSYILSGQNNLHQGLRESPPLENNILNTQNIQQNCFCSVYPAIVPLLKQEDTDWKRYLMNRPFEAFDPRKYLEFRLFWPYSSGLPGQWMSHQIDTVHWFSGLPHPRSVVANGGIYMWKDGRRNWDTMTAVFDYGPLNDPTTGFQVTFSSRMHNGDEHPAEIYYSNGGELNLITNKVSPTGGLTKRFADEMKMQPNLLPEVNLSDMAPPVASANTGGDILTSNHVRNWMECVRSRKQPNGPVEAGYSHSIATIMTNAAVHTGAKVTFDEKTQEVMANGKVFKYNLQA